MAVSRVLDALAQSNASWITFPARWIASVNSSSTVDGAAGFRDHVGKLEGRHLEILSASNEDRHALLIMDRRADLRGAGQVGEVVFLALAFDIRTTGHGVNPCNRRS